MKTLLCTMVLVLTCSFVLGQQYKVLYSFAGGQAGDGMWPVSNLLFDNSGNLYSTTWFGGSGNCTSYCGTVFKLSPNSDGTWAETILYKFCNFGNSSCPDGQNPKASLIFDAKGNIYGTTTYGGTYGLGTVFELSPPSPPGGAWTEAVLYSFCANNSNNNCLDGAVPLSQLTLDATGNLYGTTSTGGTGGTSGGCCYGGTVFELSPGQSGWTETVLYNFCAAGHDNICPDGAAPQAGVTFDKLGNLYGTTEAGGSSQTRGGGTVYKLSPGSSGWTETVLKAGSIFGSGAPLGTVSFDPLGNLYTTFSVAAQNPGGVLRLGRREGATGFLFNGADGQTPAAGVLVDSRHAALYGTTESGGTGYGNVFKIVAPAQETVLYNFCSQPNCTDGVGPFASLIEDKSGNLYGTTKRGGANNLGVVFEIEQTSPAHPRRRPITW
ncbi:MAG: choice-of-anchor tandem repeat GloVer-containing protein [Terriglobales bacterium]